MPRGFRSALPLLSAVALWHGWVGGASGQAAPEAAARGTTRGTAREAAAYPLTELPSSGWLLGIVGVGFDSQPLLSTEPVQRSDTTREGSGRAPPRGMPATPPGLDPMRGGGRTADAPPPDAAADETRLASPGPSPFMHAELYGGGQLGRAWHVGGEFALQAREYTTWDHRVDARAGVFGGWAGERWLARLHVDAGRFTASFGRDAAWYAGTRVRTSYALLPSLWLSAEGGATWRGYTPQPLGDLVEETRVSVGQHDWRLGAGMDVGWWAAHWNVSVGLLVDQVASHTVVDETASRRQRHEIFPWLGAGWQLQRWRLQTRYGPVVRSFDTVSQDGVEHLLRVEVNYALSDAWAVYARSDLGLAYGGVDAFNYRRAEVLIGMSVVLGGARRGASSLATPRPYQDQGPARVENHQVYFELDLSQFGLQAAAPSKKPDVAVIGSFNGWNAEAGRLESVGDGRYVGAFTIPPGRYRYQISIDGVSHVPPAAPAYTDDGFGGRDAVLTVVGQTP